MTLIAKFVFLFDVGNEVPDPLARNSAKGFAFFHDMRLMTVYALGMPGSSYQIFRQEFPSPVNSFYRKNRVAVRLLQFSHNVPEQYAVPLFQKIIFYHFLAGLRISMAIDACLFFSINEHIHPVMAGAAGLGHYRGVPMCTLQNTQRFSVKRR